MQVKTKDIWKEDYTSLFSEYESEDKNQYNDLFTKLFPLFENISNKEYIESELIQIPNSYVNMRIRVYETSNEYAPYFVIYMCESNT